MTIVPPASAERTGYPTQKPVRLLERIVAASSRPGRPRAGPVRGLGDDRASRPRGSGGGGCSSTANPEAVAIARRAPRRRSPGRRRDVIEAITFDFGNTLVPVPAAGLRGVVAQTADARSRTRLGPFDRRRGPRAPGPRSASASSARRSRSSARSTSPSAWSGSSPGCAAWPPPAAGRALGRRRGRRACRRPDEVAWAVDVYSRAFVDVASRPSPAAGALLAALAAALPPRDPVQLAAGRDDRPLRRGRGLVAAPRARSSSRSGSGRSSPTRRSSRRRATRSATRPEPSRSSTSATTGRRTSSARSGPAGGRRASRSRPARLAAPRLGSGTTTAEPDARSWTRSRRTSRRPSPAGALDWRPGRVAEPGPSVHSAAWRPATGSRTSALLAGAGVAWIVVAVLVTTRDPYQDAMAGLRRRAADRPRGRPDGDPARAGSSSSRGTAGSPTRATGRAPRDAGHGSACSSRSLVVLRLVDAFQLPDRAVPRRDLRRRRGHPLRRALVSHRSRRMTDSPHRRRARRARSPTSRRVPPRPSRPRATRSSTCSHRIHANPEPAFEEVQAAAWVAEAVARPRLRGRAPGRQPRDRGPRPAHRRQGHGRPADRDPRRVRRAARASATAAATTRWRRRAWARRSRSPRCATRWPARSCSSGTPAEERGSGKADHAPRRPVRGPRRRPAVPRLRPQPRRDRAAGVRGRDGHLQRARSRTRRRSRGRGGTRSTR